MLYRSIFSSNVAKWATNEELTRGDGFPAITANAGLLTHKELKRPTAKDRTGLNFASYLYSDEDLLLKWF